MQKTALGRLFNLRSVFRREQGPPCDAIWLFGSGSFAVKVVGTLREQEHLQSLVPREPLEHASCLLPVLLRSGWSDERRRPIVDVAAGGSLLGYCPSYLSTQLSEWLDRWQLSDTEVWCSARLSRGSARDDAPGAVSVFLDIDVPFRMRTIV